MTTYNQNSGIRVFSNTRGELDQWRRTHAPEQSPQQAFSSMLGVAQKLTVGLREQDSLDVVDTQSQLTGVLAEALGKVVSRNFLSFLYRDSRGLVPHKPSPFGVDPARPFEHVDVLMASPQQYEFLKLARAKAIDNGAAPHISVHDVAAAIITNIKHVSPDGQKYNCAGVQFSILRAVATRPT